MPAALPRRRAPAPAPLCPASAIIKESNAFNQAGNLCSLATFGSPLKTAFNKQSAAECCAACAATPGCQAFNWCAPDSGGCGLPGLSHTDAGDCLMYGDVGDETAWAARLMSRTPCGSNWPNLATGFLP